MTTPTTMITSMITTATTMMTDVVVAPSLEGLLVGGSLLVTGTLVVITRSLGRLLVDCVLLRTTGAVLVVVVVPLLWIGEDTPTVLEVVEIDAVEREKQQHKLAFHVYKNTRHKPQKYESDMHTFSTYERQNECNNVSNTITIE